MNAMLLVILLAHGGYWFGGDNTVTLRWAAPEATTPASTLEWRISYGKIPVAVDQMDLAPGDKTTSLSVKLPEAKAPADYVWSYTLKDKASGKVLETGERTIHLVPRNILSDPAPRLKNKSIVVIDSDPDSAIVSALKEARIDCSLAGSLSDIQVAQPDIILVAENQLADNPAAQQTLMTKARAGANVFIFAQKAPETLCAWPLHGRKLTSAPLAWRVDHPLLEHLSPVSLDGWARESPELLKPLALPADAAVLEIGNFARETPGKNPVPIDAVAATQSLGGGRIVYWQIPISSWKDDPRPRLLLASALDYMLTRPEPTLPQAQREPAEKKPVSDSHEKNLIGAGK